MTGAYLNYQPRLVGPAGQPAITDCFTLPEQDQFLGGMLKGAGKLVGKVAKGAGKIAGRVVAAPIKLAAGTASGVAKGAGLVKTRKKKKIKNVRHQASVPTKTREATIADKRLKMLQQEALRPQPLPAVPPATGVPTWAWIVGTIGVAGMLALAFRGARLRPALPTITP